MYEMLFLGSDEAGDDADEVAGAGELLLRELHTEKHEMCSKWKTPGLRPSVARYPNQ